MNQVSETLPIAFIASLGGILTAITAAAVYYSFRLKKGSQGWVTIVGATLGYVGSVFAFGVGLEKLLSNWGSVEIKDSWSVLISFIAGFFCGIVGLIVIWILVAKRKINVSSDEKHWFDVS